MSFLKVEDLRGQGLFYMNIFHMKNAFKTNFEWFLDILPFCERLDFIVEKKSLKVKGMIP